MTDQERIEQLECEITQLKEELSKKAVTPIPVPTQAVVLVLPYSDAEAIYEYICSHSALPPVFQSLSNILNHPIKF